MHTPKVLKIDEVIRESKDVKTFIFKWNGKMPQPGQFMMVWNFKDEKPMSVSFIDHVERKIGISIKKVGEFTSEVHKLTPGDMLGLRGPYGRSFKIIGEKILAIGGGIGMAPIVPLIEEARKRDVKVDAVVAAKTKDELLFLKRIKKSGAKIFPCTEDGSYGFKGLVTEFISNKLNENQYDMAVVCGPELMMKKLFEILDIPTQFSLERYMKCGCGICGQCCVDKTGWRVCVEGPVFWDYELKMIEEFGVYKRNSKGIPKKF
ncbi:oxidoreductase FAD/NAD(P)-binding domain protein [Methanothermus fervidus DSM 2088]|uniref:Probable dihydroorotate dehydrogenase B (NAD(+)), electron transfer subunit n=1 Tax=Methanothermus fervidus (strain ATCC 43054 / DSM 2088 / JCM 10308 / V24 S) TaxID=523846 RepID=E3GWP1_METFV|nr:dihydroorotate dehydrogenase electron transfer subunit [Methanothermus fervidus]ADP77960.1 oxidoreductase FAD/NAD(P)-binding domain protein [Methanothermus fervidus DSM 2088]